LDEPINKRTSLFWRSIIDGEKKILSSFPYFEDKEVNSIKKTPKMLLFVILAGGMAVWRTGAFPFRISQNHGGIKLG
jgi:hypothetical protein